MPHSCLDHLAQLPILDVVAMCARDTVDEAIFRAHGAAASFNGASATDRLILIGETLAGAIVLLRLAAFLAVAGRVALRACEPTIRRFRRPELRTLVERHRGRPAQDSSRPTGASRVDVGRKSVP